MNTMASEAKFSYSLGLFGSSTHTLLCSVGLEGGYKNKCLLLGPYEMVIPPSLQSILAITVANHGLPIIIG